MAFDTHKNFGYSTVATAPSPATSGTTLTVQSGDGTKFATNQNCTVWPANSQPTTANAEIVRITNISTDTLTITRTQESTSARSIIIGDQIANTETAKTLTDIETLFPTGTVVGTSDSQTLTNKILSDEFMGDVWDNQSAIKESITLTSSTDFVATQSVEVSGSNGLEIPATSSLEISSFYDPSSVISTKQLYVPVKFQVYLSGVQTVSTGGNRAVLFDTKIFDTSNNFSIVTNQFTAPVAGFYHFIAAVDFPATTSFTRGITLIGVNAATYRGSDVNVTTSGTLAGTVAIFVQLAVGDAVGVQVQPIGANVTLTTGQTNTYFMGYLVSTT